MKEYFYEVQLSLQTDRKGLLTAHGLQEVETFSADAPIKERKNRWTHEQLLAGSLSTCFMTAYLDCAEKRNVTILNYQSQCFVKIEKTSNGYITTAILLQPIITLQNESAAHLAGLCSEEAEKHCYLQQLLRVPIHIHVQFEYASESGSKQMK